MVMLKHRFVLVSPLRPTTNQPKRVFAATGSSSFPLRNFRATIASTWYDPSSRSILPLVAFNGKSAKWVFSWLQSILDSGSHTLGTVQACRFIVSLSGLVTTIFTLFEAFILPPPPVVITTFCDTPSNPSFRVGSSRMSVMSLPPSKSTLSITSSPFPFSVRTRVVLRYPPKFFPLLWWVCRVAVSVLSCSKCWWSSVQRSIWHCLLNLQSRLPCLYPRQLAQSCFSSTKRLLFSTESFRNLWQVTNRWFSPHRKQWLCCWWVGYPQHLELSTRKLLHWTEFILFNKKK